MVRSRADSTTMPKFTDYRKEGGLYPPPVIPSGFRSFLRNPEELNLAEGPAKFTIPGMTYSGGIEPFRN